MEARLISQKNPIRSSKPRHLLVELLVSGVLSLGSAVYFSRARYRDLTRNPDRERSFKPYGIADAIFAACWFFGSLRTFWVQPTGWWW